MEAKTYAFFYRKDVPVAKKWAVKIRAWMRKEHPDIKENSKSPDFLLVLGGDGAVLSAVQKYKGEPAIISLNLGNVGFLSSVRSPKKFLSALQKLFKGAYSEEKRMLLSISAYRGKRLVFEAESLNEAAIQSPLGMVELEVNIEDHPFQYVRGTGILVSTATGSTAFNLSAHGPVVMPEMECMIITKLLDHNIPTPSFVVTGDKVVRLKVLNFRKHGLLSLGKTGKAVDVVLSADSNSIFPLEPGDIVEIRKAERYAKFAVFEKNYFLKSVQEKFSFN
ncbi:MAG: NAD+ kinase [Parcubacteria group bacterium LiPW_15]|nr:MAG: NAD+ kinase [Parcubacteria group bacterium LiPW_15]